MIEHIYIQYPDPGAVNKYTSIQEQLHQLQSTDTWLGFQSPIGGTRSEFLDEMAILTCADEKPSWTIQKHAVYIKATEQHLKELNVLLRHLYLERYKGHRLYVAVHHPPDQKLAHRHKRSYSSTFYEGVKYLSDNTEVETYLRGFDVVQWIDLSMWCQTDDAINRLLRAIDEHPDVQKSSSSSPSDDERSAEEMISVASSECMIPCLNVHQRHQILVQ